MGKSRGKKVKKKKAKKVKKKAKKVKKKIVLKRSQVVPNKQIKSGETDLTHLFFQVEIDEFYRLVFVPLTLGKGGVPFVVPELGIAKLLLASGQGKEGLKKRDLQYWDRTQSCDDYHFVYISAKFYINDSNRKITAWFNPSNCTIEETGKRKGKKLLQKAIGESLKECSDVSFDKSRVAYRESVKKLINAFHSLLNTLMEVEKRATDKQPQQQEQRTEQVSPTSQPQQQEQRTEQVSPTSQPQQQQQQQQASTMQEQTPVPQQQHAGQLSSVGGQASPTRHQVPVVSSEEDAEADAEAEENKKLHEDAKSFIAEEGFGWMLTQKDDYSVEWNALKSTNPVIAKCIALKNQHLFLADLEKKLDPQIVLLNVNEGDFSAKGFQYKCDLSYDEEPFAVDSNLILVEKITVLGSMRHPNNIRAQEMAKSNIEKTVGEILKNPQAGYLKFATSGCAVLWPTPTPTKDDVQKVNGLSVGIRKLFFLLRNAQALGDLQMGLTQDATLMTVRKRFIEEHLQVLVMMHQRAKCTLKSLLLKNVKVGFTNTDGRGASDYGQHIQHANQFSTPDTLNSLKSDRMKWEKLAEENEEKPNNVDFFRHVQNVLERHDRQGSAKGYDAVLKLSEEIVNEIVRFHRKYESERTWNDTMQTHKKPLKALQGVKSWSDTLTKKAFRNANLMLETLMRVHKFVLKLVSLSTSYDQKLFRGEFQKMENEEGVLKDMAEKKLLFVKKLGGTRDFATINESFAANFTPASALSESINASSLRQRTRELILELGTFSKFVKEMTETEADIFFQIESLVESKKMCYASGKSGASNKFPDKVRNRQNKSTKLSQNIKNRVNLLSNGGKLNENAVESEKIVKSAKSSVLFFNAQTKEVASEKLKSCLLNCFSLKYFSKVWEKGNLTGFVFDLHNIASEIADVVEYHVHLITQVLEKEKRDPGSCFVLILLDRSGFWDQRLSCVFNKVFGKNTFSQYGKWKGREQYFYKGSYSLKSEVATTKLFPVPWSYLLLFSETHVVRSRNMSLTGVFSTHNELLRVFIESFELKSTGVALLGFNNTKLLLEVPELIMNDTKFFVLHAENTVLQHDVSIHEDSATTRVDAGKTHDAYASLKTKIAMLQYSDLDRSKSDELQQIESRIETYSNSVSDEGADKLGQLLREKTEALELTDTGGSTAEEDEDEDEEEEEEEGGRVGNKSFVVPPEHKARSSTSSSSSDDASTSSSSESESEEDEVAKAKPVPVPDVPESQVVEIVDSNDEQSSKKQKRKRGVGRDEYETMKDAERTDEKTVKKRKLTQNIDGGK